MSKLTKPVLDDDDDLFGPPLSDADVEAWFVRNREALDVSLDEARRQIARGEVDDRTFAEIIAQGTRRHLAKR